MTKTVDDILQSKPNARPRIYAYSIADAAHKGMLKVGQTTREVKQRVAEQLKTAAINNYTIELEDYAERHDGSFFRDHDVRAALVKRGCEKAQLEWVRCTVNDVKTVLTELKTGQKISGSAHKTFPMRDEQADAVNVTLDYYQSRWAEDPNAVPRFLWNAKMRFGKTFTTYQLAKKLGAKRVLVVTFKPAVEDAWQADLESHVGSTYRRRRAVIPRQSTTASLLSILAHSKTCWGVMPLGTSSRAMNGYTRSTGTSWCSMNITLAHGVTPLRSSSREKRKRLPRRK